MTNTKRQNQLLEIIDTAIEIINIEKCWIEIANIYYSENENKTDFNFGLILNEIEKQNQRIYNLFEKI